MKTSFFDYNFEELKETLARNGINPKTAALLFNWHYKKKRTSACKQNVSIKAQEFIEKNFSFDRLAIDTVRESCDGTVKFLFKLKDGRKVETVLIPFINKYSICLSSQVGCAMNCSFCYTGKQGLTRNLKTHEIVCQFLEAWHWLAENRPGEERILNIVFMGQGEPLHNFDAVKKSCEIFLSQYGASVGTQKITISTAGYLPGLKRWAEEIPGVNLALSLHSPFKEKRDELIPLNKAYPLEEVLQVIDEVPLGRKQFITFEYLLIKDFNDSLEDARATGKLLEKRQALVNLIPFNPIPDSSYERPDLAQVERFKNELEKFDMPIMIRGIKGDDVLGACGQLNSVASSV